MFRSILDNVELKIDSSFYRIRNEFTVKNWYRRTLGGVRFTIKFPKVVTHVKRPRNMYQDQLDHFFDFMSELKVKLLALLVQLPPSIQIVERFEKYPSASR